MTDSFLPLLEELAVRKRRLHTPEIFNGRGIVTAFGGVRSFTCGYVLIRLLREELKCTLPIEVWHYGEAEITPSMRHLLAPYEVTLVDARSVQASTDAEVQDGWQLKALAMLYCSFAEALFLDADQVPMVDPTAVFEFDQFKSSGAVFWPDIVDIRKDNPIWAKLGLANRRISSFESGQLLIDRTRNMSALKAVVALNEMKEEVYASVYGDKDTFLLGFLLEQALFEVVPHRPFIVERALIQRDFDGSPLFQHRTNAKWLYSGRQVTFEGERFGEVCEGYLQDLNQHWNGLMFYPPDRSRAARQEETLLQKTGEVRLEFTGDRNETIELLPSHEIGVGRSLDRQNWYIVERDDKLILAIEANGQVLYNLSRCDDGRWQGYQHQKPACLVVLHANQQRQWKPREVDHGLVANLVAACDLRHGGSRSRAELQNALTLLLRAEPGVRPAIEALADVSPMLLGIADLVLDAVPVPCNRAPNKNIEVLGTGYQDWRKKAW